MKHSMIHHPSGSGWSRIDFWVLEVLGEKEHAAAVVLSQLEFWQQLQLERLENNWVKDDWVRRGPADFSAALRGLYGEDKIRAGLRLLVSKGWIEEGEETELIGQLWKRRKKFRLVISKINEVAERFSLEKSKNPDLSGSGKPKNRDPEPEKSEPRARNIGLNTNNTAVIPTNHNNTMNGGSVFFSELPDRLQEKTRVAVQGMSLELQHDVVDELIGQIREEVAKYPERLLLTLVNAAKNKTLTLDFATKERSRRAAARRGVAAREKSPLKNSADAAVMIEAGEAMFEKARKKAASKNLAH